MCTDSGVTRNVRVIRATDIYRLDSATTVSSYPAASASVPVCIGQYISIRRNEQSRSVDRLTFWGPPCICTHSRPCHDNGCSRRCFCGVQRRRRYPGRRGYVPDKSRAASVSCHDDAVYQTSRRRQQQQQQLQRQATVVSISRHDGCILRPGKKHIAA